MENKEKKPNIFKRFRASMTANVTGGIISLVLLFGFVTSLIGYFCINDAFEKEYASITYHMAESAALDFNADHIDNYLNGEEMEEYEINKARLEKVCYALNVSLIYVIKVDTTDYGRFTNIINIVNNTVDDSNYSPWEIGYQRNTTNDEYRSKYKAIYENGSKYETLFRIRTTDGQHPHITTLIPVKSSTGTVAGILCMQRPVNEMRKAMAPYLLWIILGVVLMGVFIIFVAILFLRNSVIKPIARTSDEAKRFAETKARNEPLGRISRYKVILDLANSIDSMEEDMVNYVNDLTIATADKERMATELNIAANIQKSSIPDVWPAFPNRDEFDIYASMDPAKEVGGDFYNFFLIDNDHLGLVIADVSGKGVPASLFMMATNILLSDRAMMGGTPNEILEFVNNNICDHNEANMFVTVWLGIYEISTGKLTSASAGHEDPYIYRKDKYFKLQPEPHGFVIGGFKGCKYKNNEITLDVGDKLFIYTDGLTEAKNKESELFSIERVGLSLSKHKTKSPQDILSGVKEDVGEFVKDNPQFDDLTMLCLERKK